LKTVESSTSLQGYSQSSLKKHLPTKEASRHLIFHAHGGGFFAQTSKSHEFYLKTWCKKLKVPIVTVDYSLTPEHIFPRASDECFYVYAWCLLNKEALGWTGENVICVGDSAGGVLVTNVVQRAIMTGIQVPDALVPIYTPFLMTCSFSPSRLLSVLDPLLNVGLSWRCLIGYCGLEWKSECDKYKRLLNLNTDPAATATNDEKKSKKKLIGGYKSKKVVETSGETRTKEQQTNTERAAKILDLHQVMGDSAFFVEKLKNNPILSNPLASPLLTDESVLSQFPPTFLIVSFFFIKKS
jgi:acetyl esterase/lipase